MVNATQKQGEMIGRYRILSFLGRGGMAEAYKCQLTGIGGFDKTVVIKRVLPDLGGQGEFVKMFLDEARMVAQLNHPNIVHVWEVGEADGLPYLAMEYVHGPTLSQIHHQVGKKHPIPIAAAVQIISGICQGLDHAHNATGADGQPLGIVHRDVSPQNIMVSVEGQPKLLDFGVAKSHVKLAQTRAGTVKGKPAYMAPEQLRGEAIDQRADVFTAGICLYRATTGVLPFSGSTEMEVMSALMANRLKRPSEVLPDYPEKLEKIVLWALHPDPQRRCPSALKLHQALQAFSRQDKINASDAGLAKWIGELFSSTDAEYFDRYAASRRASSDSVSLPEVSAQLDARQAASGSGQAHLSVVPGPPTATPTPATSAMTPSALTPDALTPSGASPLPPGSAAQYSPPSGVHSYPQGPPAGFSPPTGVQVPGTVYTTMAPAQRSPWGAVALAMALVMLGLIAAGVVIFLKQQTPTPQAAATPPPTIDNSESVRQYLQQAQKSAEAKQFKIALELLDKARQLKSQNVELNIQLSRVSSAIEVDAYLHMARMAQNRGDVVQAKDLAKKVLDRDYENADALALLAELSPPSQSARAAPASSGKGGHSKRRRSRAVAVKPGSLEVTTRPVAQVYVDDRPLGRSPIEGHDIDPGSHVVELRLEGYKTVKRTIEVSAGEKLQIDLSLEKQVDTSVSHKELVAQMAQTTDVAVAQPAPVKPADPSSVAAAAAPRPAAPEAKTAEAQKKSAPSSLGEASKGTPKIGRPKLPGSYTVSSAGQVAAAFQKIESEIARVGGPARGVARNVTVPLAKELIRDFTPGQRISLYPRAMFYFVVDQASAGRSRSQIAEALRRAHRARQLKNYRPQH